MKLYEITVELEALDKFIEWYADEHEGEVSPDLQIKLDAIELEYKAKLENIGRLIKHKDAAADAIEHEIIALEKRKKALERQSDWLKQYVLFHLDGDRFQSPTVEFSLRRSKRVEVPDESLVPERFLKAQPAKVDKQGIRDALTKGEVLPFARLIEKMNLQVK